MKKCLVELSDGTAGLGDILIILPYLEKFRISYNYEVFFMIKNYNLKEIFYSSFPHINIVPIGDKSMFDKVIQLEHKDHS